MLYTLILLVMELRGKREKTRVNEVAKRDKSFFLI